MFDIVVSAPAPMIGSPDYQRLPLGERERLAVLIPLLGKLEKARPVGVALKAAAQACAHRRGSWSEKTLETHLGLWRRHHDWTLHIDRRCSKTLQRMPEEDASLRSTEFTDYWHALCEDYKRSTSGALRELKRRFKAGSPIPGYGTWRDWYAVAFPGAPMPAMCPGYPKGWSDRTLYRLKPSKVMLALARHGFKRHAELTSYTLRTTRHLKPMQLLVADDFRLDLMCILPRALTIGGRTFGAGPTMVVGMILLDVCSRKVIGWCLRPAAKDEDGVKAVMGREDLALLAGQAFLEHGLPEEYPVEFYTERATATFTAEVRGWMKSAFGDKVRFRSTGVFDNVLAEYGYAEGGGKAWHKGWVEAFFPRMHNELAAMPGQIGARYDLAPGDHDNRLRAATAMMKAAEKVSDRCVEKLRFPFPTFERVCEVFARFIDESNARTDHNLEGFDEVMRWRLTDAEPWREDINALALLPRDAVLAARYENRKQSPSERWAAKFAESRFSPVHMSAVAPLLSKSEPVSVRRGMIRIERDGAAHHFFLRGHELLDEGARYLSHWSWLYPDEIHLYRESSLAYLGSVPRAEAIDATDVLNLGIAGRAMRFDIENEVAAYRSRHADKSVRDAGDRMHNAAVLRGEHESDRIADRLRGAGEPVRAESMRGAMKPKRRRDVEDL